MIKLLYTFKRKEGMSVAEFQTYWRETHGPIAARIPGVRRYIQNHTLPELYAGDHPPAYDGTAELWFDDLDAFRTAIKSPENAAAQEDEKNFLDHTDAVFMLAEEKPVID